MHTHGPVVHDGLRGWRVLDDGSVRKFTLAHACSEPGDEREIREGRLFFHDLFALGDEHGVCVPHDVDRHFALPTGELLHTRDGWVWVSVSGWTRGAEVSGEPVASANGFLLVREKGGLRTLPFEPPMCQHADWREDVTGAEDILLYRNAAWRGASVHQLQLARFPYYVKARLTEDGIAFTNARASSAGTAARTAALRVGQTEVVSNDPPARPWNKQYGTSWTTWRVRGASKHDLCARVCDHALACATTTTPVRAATHKQMFCGFLVCAYGLVGRTVPTQLAIQYLVRVVHHHFKAHASPAALAWMAFVLLQEKRDVRISRIVRRMQPAAGATGFSGVRGASERFWEVVREYQRVWPLSNEFSASFALAIDAPRDPQQHSLYLPIEPRFDMWVSKDNPRVACIETAVSRSRMRLTASRTERHAMMRNHVIPWHDVPFRHTLLRTVAVCAALHLFRYPTWLRIMELHWVIDFPTRRALAVVPYQTARYEWPEDEAMQRLVEEELWAFFRAAYTIYRSIETDPTRANDTNKATSSLSIAMHVRRELGAHTFTRLEYRSSIAPLFAASSNPLVALERVLPDVALWQQRDWRMHNRWCKSGWCSSRSRAEAEIEALRDSDEQRALGESLRAPPNDHPTSLTWVMLSIALGMYQQPLFKRVSHMVDPSLLNYEDRLLLVLPAMVHDIHNGHVPATSLPALWSV